MLPTKPMNPKRASRMCTIELNIPEGSLGAWQIKHKKYPAGERMPLVTMRTAFMYGLAQQSVEFDSERTVHNLLRAGNVVMSDTMPEIFDHAAPAMQMRGNVLVGGLGLGLVVHLMAKFNPRVTHVTVVEKEFAVASLVAPWLPAPEKYGITLIQDDIFKFAKRASPRSFNSAYMDTWTGTGEAEWAETLVPLRRLLVGRRVVCGDRIACWQEGVMHAQLRESLAMALAVPPDIAMNMWKPHRAFIEAAREAGLVKLAELGRKPTREDIPKLQERWSKARQLLADKKVAKLMKLYLEDVGSEKWEATFGTYWDRCEQDAPERRLA